MNKSTIQLISIGLIVTVSVSLFLLSFPSEHKSTVETPEPKKTVNETCKKLAYLGVLASESKLQGYTEQETFIRYAMSNTTLTTEAFDREAIHYAYINEISTNETLAYADIYNHCGWKFARNAR